MRSASSLSGSPVAAVSLVASASRSAATWLQAFLNVLSQDAERIGAPSEARQNSSPERPIWVWSRRWAFTASSSAAGIGRVREATPLRAVFKADLNRSFGFLHCARHGHRGHVSTKAEVASLKSTDLAGAQAEHTAQEHAESQPLRHRVSDPEEHGYWQWCQVAFAGHLGLGSGLDLDRVDVDEFVSTAAFMIARSKS